MRTNGEEIMARVLTITLGEVKYLPINERPSTDTVYLATSDIFMVRYASGSKVLLNTTASKAPKRASERTAAEMAIQGRMDAQQYFKAPGSLFGTAAATTLSVMIFGPSALGTLGGIATGTAIAASPVQDKNFIVPDEALLNDPNYLDGYQKQAQRKKLGKVGGGLGIGLVTGTVLWFVVALSRTNHF
ncbi:hypothetical protein ACW9KT_02495 [Hymenobacter sp. HD11105]